MPIGVQIKGRLMNVVGEAVDGMKELDKNGAYPIHREPPKFEELSTSQEVLFTGIKVIDLLERAAKIINQQEVDEQMNDLPKSLRGRIRVVVRLLPCRFSKPRRATYQPISRPM